MSSTLPEFHGWSTPDQNWSKLPHQLVDLISKMKESELKVTLYILRHTWGFANYDEFQAMTVDEIQNGRKGKGGIRIDDGTGLSKQSVITGTKAGIVRGTLEEIVNDKDKARIKKGYRLRAKENQGSKIWTSGVKNLDLDLNKETTKRKKRSPRPKAGNKAQKRKPTNRAMFNTAMEQEFHKASNIALPIRVTQKDRKRAGEIWNNPLWRIYKLFRPEEERQGEVPLTYEDDSLQKALTLIRLAVEASGDLTIASPASIEKIANSIHAKQFSAVGDSSDWWDQFDDV